MLISIPTTEKLNGSKIVLKQVIDKKHTKTKMVSVKRAVDGMLRVRENEQRPSSRPNQIL
jgi:hypothetical protein